MRSCFIPALLLLLSVPSLADEGRRSWPSHGYRVRAPYESYWVPPAGRHHLGRPHWDDRPHHITYVPVYREPRPVFIPAPPPLPLPPPPVTIHIRLGF